MIANRLVPTSSPRWAATMPATLAGVQREMDRWFDEFFGPGSSNGHAAEWTAPWACWEDEKALYLEVELPGVSQDDVEIVAHHGKLLLKCDRKVPEGEKNYHFNTRRYGRTEGTLNLPETVDCESVEAELRNGVLLVRVAKRPEAQPKKIAVESA